MSEAWLQRLRAGKVPCVSRAAELFSKLDLQRCGLRDYHRSLARPAESFLCKCCQHTRFMRLDFELAAHAHIHDHGHFQRCVLGHFYLSESTFILTLAITDTTSGPTAIMALLTGEIVTDLTKEGYEGHIIATAVVFMCGIYGLAFGFLKLGFLLDFIPVPVLSGHVSAAALTIIIQQIPSIFAETGAADSVAEDIHEICQNLPRTKWRDLLIGFSCIILLCDLQYVGRRWGKKHRALWFLSICRNAMILVIFTGISYGVNKELKKPLFKISKTSGTGILTPTVPDTQLAGKLAGRAVAVFLAAALEHLAIGKAFCRRGGYTIDQSQELLYIGVANFVGVSSRPCPSPVVSPGLLSTPSRESRAR